MDNYFSELNTVDVSGKTEVKNGLTYLSWAWAWAETKKRFPDAEYTVKKFENNLPYVYDEKTGYMVFTEVTINGVTHEMWLPVMDGANKAMKNEPYTYYTGFGANRKEKTVAAADSFDINKTIMRCLTKNLAMHGLGLYIYAGEDLPESVDGGEKPKASEPKATSKPIEKIAHSAQCAECGASITEQVAKHSTKFYKKPLCIACQDKAKKVQMQQKIIDSDDLPF